jgi:hypothetical protein
MQVAFGVTLDGPIGHVWYTLLDGKVFPNEPTSNKAVVAKMLLDQLIWAPFFSCVFFLFTNVLAVCHYLGCGQAMDLSFLIPHIPGRRLRWQSYQELV